MLKTYVVSPRKRRIFLHRGITNMNFSKLWSGKNLQENRTIAATNAQAV